MNTARAAASFVMITKKRHRDFIIAILFCLAEIVSAPAKAEDVIAQQGNYGDSALISQAIELNALSP